MGEHPYRVDEKGRVPFPPVFRESLESGVVLSRGLEKCIVAYPVSLWEEITAKSSILPPAPARVRRMNRHMFALASYAKFDIQGRILLPPLLRSYAEIDEDIVMIGVNNYVEIWGKENWASEEPQIFEEAWQFSEGVDGYRFGNGSHKLESYGNLELPARI